MALEQDPNDTEIIVRLGEIFSLLEDYTTANLYFNNAIMAGYTPKTLIERRLAYNYAKLGDKEGMKKVLGYLLQENDVTEDDFAVAISLAVEQEEFLRAYSWAYEGVTLFPDSHILLPLYLQSLRLAGNVHEAQMVIHGLTSEAQELPLVQLEQAILHFQKDNLVDAKRIFTALKEFDPDTDFARESERYLHLIQEKEKIQEEERRQAELSAQSGTQLTP